jgi:DNA-binding CsgD family transcriptional regulator
VGRRTLGERRQSLPAVGVPRLALEGVVGRESELERIGGFLDDGGSALGLWLEGVAGIGKTTLWRAGIGLARERGLRVLASRPTATETALSFAALGDLLSNAAEEVLPDLPAPQRRALEVALALASSDGTAVSERVIGLALLSTLHLLEAQGPVLVAVDDVQWLDPPSAAALRFAARRLADGRVKLLLAARLEAETPPLRLEHDLSERLVRIEVGPLSMGALHRLVLSRLGEPLSRPTLRRVHDASAGNPFYALEIARFLLEGGAPLRPAEQLPIPRTLDELVRARLGRLPETIRRVLEAAALIADPTPQALAAVGFEPEDVGKRLDRAVAAGVIEPDEDQVRFTHPLLAAAVVSGIGLRRRRQLHARLAQIAVDPEERARHLALGTEGADARVAESLERAARHAALRGAPAVAAELAELAAERTPSDAQEQRWRRLIEAGLRHAVAGDHRRARALLGPLADEIPPGPLRADVLLNLADFHWDEPEVAVELAQTALAEVGGDDRRRARLHMLLSSLALEAQTTSALPQIRAALQAAERSGDEELKLLALVNLVHVEVCTGELTPGLLEQARARVNAEGGGFDRIPHFESPGFPLALALLGLGRFEEARPLLERARADSLDQGIPFGGAVAALFLAELECRLGNWREAALQAAECWELYEPLGTNLTQPCYARALVAAHVGQVDEARAAGERGVADARRAGLEFWGFANRRALGLLELSLGNPARAVEYLRPPQELGTGLWRMPSNWDYLETSIEALVSAGNLDRAGELIEGLEEWTKTTDGPWQRSILARCRGLLDSAEGDYEGAFADLDEALRAHERLNMPFDRARTLLALGVLQRRVKQRRAARESLEAAVAVFEELGAPLWADRTRAELERIGGRTPAGDMLTPTERRVAELVAEGRPNKDIAALLFVTVKAVEANLTRVYAKLGIQSRTELTRLLARGRG